MGGGGAYHTPWHWHDSLMIFLPEVGAVEFRDETSASAAWLSQDRFVAVPTATAHQTTAAHGNHRHMAIYATESQLATIETLAGSLSRVRTNLIKPALFAITPEMRSLQRLCRVGGAADEVALATGNHLVTALLINCLAQIARGDQLSAAGPDGHGEMLIAEIKSFIIQNAGTDLPLDLIADRFRISRRHATRLFREHTGFSIAAFHEHERIKQARDLLSGTTLPVGEIAWRVGFESGSALARAMRRVTGDSPTGIRREMARHGAA